MVMWVWLAIGGMILSNLANDRMVYSISLPTDFTKSTELRYEATERDLADVII